MKIIGLTGGIGSGKSTVSDYLKSKNLIVLDADQMSREMTQKDGEALPEILDTFGKQVFFDNGELNRKALAKIVFNDEESKSKLESIITFNVVKKLGEKVEKYKKDGKENLIFIDAPLLFEAKADSLCDEVWLVVADLEARIDRVMKRDNFTREEVLARIDNQMTDEIKEQLADVILDNTKDQATLYEQIDRLLNR